LSFFDEADEPRTEPRTRRPSGSGRRPPTDQQAIQVRRAVAAVAILVVIILLVVGIHSCQVSQRNSSLRDYNHSVSSLIQQSNQLGQQLFRQLPGAGGTTNATGLTTALSQTAQQADSLLSKAKSLDVPSEMNGAQQTFVLVMSLRRDGISDIARNIQQAMGTSASGTAVNSIATDMARFFASDVVYKTETAPMIAAALHAAGITVGPNGETIADGQFLPDLGWLSPDFIRAKLGVAGAQTPTGTPAPGPHGHSLDSVSVGGTTLQTGSTNTIPATPPPSFTVNFTNGGSNTERNVVVKVTVSGTNISAQTVVPQTTAGQHATATVQLPSSPPPGTYTVTVTVMPVPGETRTDNNTLSFPVQFK
jgi:hypothetical protein